MKSTKQLPARARLDQLKRQAKELHASWRAGEPEARERVLTRHPRGATAPVRLADAQLVLAREYGFATWLALRQRVEAIDLADPITAFTEAACIGLHDHGRGGIGEADALRHAHAAIGRDVFTAAILGDDAVLAELLAAEPAKATEPGGLYDWDPLTYLCFSRYLRPEAVPGDRFERAARLLLDHGAEANTGFYWQEHSPEPTQETAIYGAAAVARHAGVTRLLLERGADPNDGETPYHLAESHDDTVMKLVVESGRFDAASLATLLVRKHDMHDRDAVAWLLAHCADPDRMTMWGVTPLHHAIRRNNELPIIELLLDHGADPRIPGAAIPLAGVGLSAEGRSAVALAARAGRADVLALFVRRGFLLDELSGVARLIAACALDEPASTGIATPELVREVGVLGGELLATFASVGNTRGLVRLLDLGVPIDTPFRDGNSYLGVARGSTALHVAAWCARHDTVSALIERGAPIDLRDAKDRTPLALAVRACVDSYWTGRREPTSVEALLAAGASADAVDRYPSGYAPVDALIAARRRG